MLGGYPAISRTAAPDAAAPRASRCAFHPRERRLDHRGPTAHEWSKGNAAMNPLNNLPSAVSGAIPARAGFTGADRLRRGRDPDHPRSRGVYVQGNRDPYHYEGSSPLARGLLLSRARACARARIIPARAGFTRRRRDARLGHPDHPRSRGVYRRIPATGPQPSGSSPLARGLLPGRVVVQRVVRIIPARAGFTPHRMETTRL